MLGAELRVAVHHRSRLPAAQFLQLVAARASLPMPRSPGVPQVVKAKIGQLRFLHRLEPAGVADAPPDRLSAVVGQFWMDVNIHDNIAARQAIDRACLLTKSREWAYEGEWRLLGQVGLQESPMKLKSVIFGMRCADVLKYTLAKALQGRPQNVKFWEIAQPTLRFELKRSRLDVEGLMRGMPRTSVLHDFADLSLADSDTTQTAQLPGV